MGVRQESSRSRDLRPVVGVSGDLPVFDDRHLQALRWAALHYVAPLVALLRKPGPPNLPRLRGGMAGRVGGRPVRREKSPPKYLVRGRPEPDAIASLAHEAVAGGGSAVVVCPTVREAAELRADLARLLPSPPILASSSLPAKEVTSAWITARLGAGEVVVGTREVAFWPVAELAAAVIVDEGRRAMKAKETPTTHVREILRRRAALEGFQLTFIGAVPTTEAIAAGVAADVPEGRVWPLVEVVDRSEEPPGSGLITERVRRALALGVKKGDRSFVLVHRRGYAPAFGCVRCRTVRRCPVCGAASDRGDTCRRCDAHLGSCVECGGERFEPFGAGVGRVVDDLRRTLGDGVQPMDANRGLVRVGTERDLPGAGRVALAAAVDIDGLMLAPHYRSAEDALRVVARLASLVTPGSGHRCLVQTGMPNHPVIAALRRGRPMSFLSDEIGQRSAAGFPPLADLIAVEVGGNSDGVDDELREVTEGTVRGPAPVGEGRRWLLQGTDLRRTRLRMRDLVQRWRDRGGRVRIDVDPIDL